GGTLKRTFRLLLAPGENRIEVRAASGDGSWESEPAVVVLRYQKPPERVRLHVLAVGVSRYADSALNLKYAADDARAVAEVFAKRGAALFAVPKPLTLVDADATPAKIHQAVKDIAGRAKPEDVLVVFVAGHGTALGQRFYFVPYDFQRTDGATV